MSKAPQSSILLALLVLGSMAPAQGRRPTQPGPGDVAAMVERLGSGVDWAGFDPVVLPEGENRAAVMKSAQEYKDLDRSALLDAALEKAKAANRLVLWYAPRVTSGMGGRQMYRPAVVDLYAKAVFFTDPDVVDLLNRMFVPVRLAVDAKLGERFGIKAPERVEPLLIILRPDGSVVRLIDRVRTFNAGWLDAVLRGALAEAPAQATDSKATAVVVESREKGEADAIDLASARFRDGALEKVLEELGALHDLSALDQARAALLSARAARRLGRIDACLHSLLEAEAGTAKVTGRAQQRSLADAIHVERGRALLGRRQFAEARAEFLAVPLSSSLHAKSQFLCGIADYFDGAELMAQRRMKEAVIDDPDNPWSWKAAANLVDGPDRTPLGPTFHGFEDETTPTEEAVASGDSSVRHKAAEIKDVAADAVQFLLRMQRKDGSWPDSRYAYWSSPDLTPNVWIAATTLACSALMGWRELAPERIDEALRRGEAYAFDDRNLAPGSNEEIYAQGYRLFYLCRKFDHLQDADLKKETIERMQHVIARLEAIQGRGEGASKGFWAHEYPNAFATASVMNALELARQRGATLPPTMMMDGAQALLSSRDADGGFAYGAGRAAKADPATRDERLKNSMGRSAICEAAILWAHHSEGSTDKVTAALDSFWKFLPNLERIRKCDFHTDGELGGFFFWHAVFHTTEAIKALPKEAQLAHDSRMIEFLSTLAEQDGSFIDSHEIGKSYGTAMGLLSIENALKHGEP